MIHIVLGTKAQLIKTAPLMQMMQSRGIPYNYIFTGQHKKGVDELHDAFSLKKPDIVLYSGKDIVSLFSMLIWSAWLLCKSMFSRNRVFRVDRSGVVLVHGDTITTLIGALMGRMAGLKVAHIEAGLRSSDFFHPFPEEVTRVLTSYLSDYFFCPGHWAIDNLRKHKGIKVNTFENTLFDTFQAAVAKMEDIDVNIPEERYCIVSIHRYENLLNKKRLNRIIEIVEDIALSCKVLFVLHPVTEKKLHAYNLYSRVEENPAIEMRGRYDYFKFIKLVCHCEFLVTDGGGNQEESFYMGKPCLLLRRKTERLEGLNRNVCLSKMEDTAINSFVKNYRDFIIPVKKAEFSPSEIIVDEIRKFA
ncbi:MAG: UDP-N-acetylglucosamine 2-epimerase [Nitrospirae bacterium]|nr:UDP-N-acetylglucosamine 2-epimerase [Nitrospirota bacterium]